MLQTSEVLAEGFSAWCHDLFDCIAYNYLIALTDGDIQLAVSKSRIYFMKQKAGKSYSVIYDFVIYVRLFVFLEKVLESKILWIWT